MAELGKPYILGLTGSIGSGKSFVTSLLANGNAAVVCADELARDVVKRGSPALEEIVTHFGRDVLTNEGDLDRRRLAEVIFADNKKRQTLEQIVHPRVRDRELGFISDHQDSPLIVVDVPLLFESGFDRECHGTLTVLLDPETRFQRLKEHRSMSRSEVESRLSKQMPQEEKASRSTFLVDNSYDRPHTCRQLNRLLRKIFSASLPAPLRFPELSTHQP